MSMVICKLPNAGLGNQLFPLMHAYLFAKLNDLPVIVVGYHRLKIGPYLRKERSKRSYNRCFCFQKNITGEYLDRLRAKMWEKKLEAVIEPEIREISIEELKNKVFVFHEIDKYDNYFSRLKNHRKQVKAILYSLLNSRIQSKLNQQEPPVIGVHVRMGDFRKLSLGEEYRSGHVRTPQEFFVECIKTIRNVNGNNLPMSIFTDGYRDELQEMLQVGNVKLIDKNPSIVDLLLLSKSKIILPTHGSTFSAWAAFLSDVPTVLPFDYKKPLREDNFYKNVYEGKLDPENEILIKNIKEICE